MQRRPPPPLDWRAGARSAATPPRPAARARRSSAAGRLPRPSVTACSAAATRPAVLAPRTGRRTLRPLPRRQPTLTRLRGAAANPAGWPWRTRLSARSGRILEYVHEVRSQPPRRQQAARLSADSLDACLLQGENRPADTWKCHKPGCGQQFRTRENLVKHNSRTSHHNSGWRRAAVGRADAAARPAERPSLLCAR